MCRRILREFEYQRADVLFRERATSTRTGTYRVYFHDGLTNGHPAYPRLASVAFTAVEQIPGEPVLR